MKSIIVRVHFVFILSFALLFAVMGAHHKASQNHFSERNQSVNETDEAKKPLTLALFFSIFLILLTAYAWLIKSLKPLKRIKQKIINLRGDESQGQEMQNGDEVSQIIEELERTNQTVRTLLAARQMFLRAIIHEINSPVGKGRIVAELVEDEKQKARLVKIFDHMDKTVKEFVHIEQILSENMRLDAATSTVRDILHASLELLECSVGVEIVNNSQNPSILADKEILALGFKNLIQNGLKYSDDKKMKVEIFDNKIVFQNRGKNIESIEKKMNEPCFSKASHTRNGGLGLGLYIINSTIRLHQMGIEYLHADGSNIFTVYFEKQTVAP